MDYSAYMQQIIDSCVTTWEPYVNEFMSTVPGWLVPVLGIFGAVIVVGKIIQVVHMVVDYRGMQADIARDRERGLYG